LEKNGDHPWEDWKRMVIIHRKMWKKKKSSIRRLTKIDGHPYEDEKKKWQSSIGRCGKRGNP
jgi:hypothetical protein